jgi:hypothetical protein
MGEGEGAVYMKIYIPAQLRILLLPPFPFFEMGEVGGGHA